ncbi:MAG: radical SAM protein [Clostridia bacterium]|nr:radical SAM protein [Clostridia bacterium]
MHFVNAKGILSGSGGRLGMNIYRGCTHGCIYCDSRSACYQFTHPFEDVEVKQNAPELLEKALRSKRRKCMIGTGAMSDPYMHCEEKLRLTRRCLEIIRDHGFGAAIITKSDRILEDIDLLDEINRSAKCVVQMTLTTYDDKLCAILEPNVCNTKRRIEVLEKMQERGIPTVVWLTPILPYINDTRGNIAAILDECVRVGVKGIIDFGMGLTLREGDREYYYAALDRHFPGLKERYIRQFGNAYVLPSPRSGELRQLLLRVCAQNGIMSDPEECFSYMQELPEKYTQLSLFDSETGAK